MLTSLTKVTRYSLRSTQFKPLTPLTTPNPYIFTSQRNFGSFFKRENQENRENPNSEDLQKESSRKKKSFLLMAKEALLEGFLKGPDFHRMEQSIMLREARTHCEAAENSFSQCKYQSALENYKIALRLVKESLGDDHPELAYYLGRIGDVYYEVKEWDHAFNSYKESLELLEMEENCDNEEIARYYFRTGMCCLKSNKQGEAVDYIKQALRFYSKSRKSEVRDSVIVSCNTILAECYTRFGQYNKALKYMERAIDTLERDDKSGGIDVPMSQHSLNYGLLLAHANKDFEKAFKYMKAHHSSQTKMNGEEGYSVGMSYLRLGEVYGLQEKYDEALVCYEKAKNIMEKKTKNEDKRVGLCYKGIGDIYGHQGKYKQCAQHMKMALKCFEEEDSELGECYKSLAFAYGKLNKESLAIENLKKSVEHREKLLEGLEEGDAELMVMNGLLAGGLYKEGRYDEGMICVEGLMKEVCKMMSGK